ncbi:MAG: hypothetical protein EPN37_16790 [Chitinophagaceae bacterium]|jgi:hypothetical protein|nr:MAG: hypothetical protein EPN37_16790 [Chitinophagaceae bacterium]
MQEITTYRETEDESAKWLYCEDDHQNKYVFYRGHPAFLAKFIGVSRCLIEGMEERFSFSDPYCRELIALAEQKGVNRFGKL